MYLGCDLQQDFAHGAGFEAGEGFMELVEGPNGVDQGLIPAGGQGGDDLGPGLGAFGRGVGADMDAGDSQAAEEEGGGVEFGDGAREAADDADAAAVGEGVDDFGEEGAADVVDGEIDAAAGEGGAGGLFPVGVGGAEGDVG